MRGSPHEVSEGATVLVHDPSDPGAEWLLARVKSRHDHAIALDILVSWDCSPEKVMDSVIGTDRPYQWFELAEEQANANLMVAFHSPEVSTEYRGTYRAAWYAHCYALTGVPEI